MLTMQIATNYFQLRKKIKRDFVTTFFKIYYMVLIYNPTKCFKTLVTHNNENNRLTKRKNTPCLVIGNI